MQKKDCPMGNGLENGGKYVTIREFMQWIERVAGIERDVKTLNGNIKRILDTTEALNTSVTDRLSRIETILEELQSISRLHSTRLGNVELKQNSLSDEVSSLRTSLGDVVKRTEDKINSNKWLWSAVLVVIVGWALALSFYIIKLLQHLK